MTVYFISGHCDLSYSEFLEHYKFPIDQALESENAMFVIGDSRGCDSHAQQYLIDKTKLVTVYHMKTKPLNNLGNYQTSGGYKSHKAKDSAMTLGSDQDIAWVRSVEEQKKLYGSKYRKRKSGTEKNINRRKSIEFKDSINGNN